jgi:hypothetical protein
MVSRYRQKNAPWLSLPDLSAHGLRKALHAIGANSGFTDRELMAIAGHETSEKRRATPGHAIATA